MMTTSTTVSLKLINESGAKRKVIESAVEEYYLKGEKGILVSQNFTLVPVNGTGIQLKNKITPGDMRKHIQKIISAMSTIILIRLMKCGLEKLQNKKGFTLIELIVTLSLSEFSWCQQLP